MPKVSNCAFLTRPGVAKYAAPDWALVGAALAEHVFGAAFVELARVPDVQPRETALLVAGSDGSSHTGYVRGVPAPQYVEEEGRMLLTFNNSVAYIDLPAGHPHLVALLAQIEAQAQRDGAIVFDDQELRHQ